MDVWAIKHGVSRLGFGPMPLNKKMWYDLNLGGIMGCPWDTLQGSYPHCIFLVPIVGNVCDPVLLEGCLMLTSIIPILTTHIHYDYDYQLPTQVHWNQAAKLHRWLHTSCKRVAWAATLGWHGLESTSKMLMGKRSCSSHALVIHLITFTRNYPHDTLHATKRMHWTRSSMCNLRTPTAKPMRSWTVCARTASQVFWD